MTPEKEKIEISPLVIAGLERWFTHGVLPGHFMTAVLTNDLREAVVRADDANARALVDIVNYIRLYAPIGCWGSPAAVNRWKLSKRRERQQVEA